VPKVSVIILTYNRKEFLKAAIQSVLEQSYQDFEIIIVDDGSNDGTAAFVGSLTDPRINYIRNDTNQGEARSRNIGINRSSGEFIAFLDDDDEWLSSKLEKQVRLLESSPAIVAGVYTGFTKVDVKTGKIVATVLPQKRGYIYNAMATYNWVGTPSTVLIRKECFDEVGPFDDDIVFGPDNDMWIRIAQKYHFDFVAESLVKYAEHLDKLSFNNDKMIKGWQAQLAKHANLFSQNPRSYSLRYLDLGVLYCQKGDLRQGRKAFMQAIRIYPFELRHYFNACLSLLGAGNFRKIKRFKEGRPA
jgi:glycosyltransferase involved in cell wall biosynthesis